MHGEMRNSQLIRRPQREKTTQKTWRINVKIIFSEKGCDSVNWVQIVEERVHLWVPVKRTLTFHIS
jgi:hypothetical protein